MNTLQLLTKRAGANNPEDIHHIFDPMKTTPHVDQNKNKLDEHRGRASQKGSKQVHSSAPGLPLQKVHVKATESFTALISPLSETSGHTHTAE